MKRPPLKPHLLKWINEHPGVHRKVDLYPVGDEIEFSAESVGRELRNLEKAEEIHVDYYDGKYVKGLAQYSALPITQKPLLTFRFETQSDGRRIAIPQWTTN